MAIFKCKMCGGNLNVSEGITIAECEFCGTEQTISKATDEIVTNLFGRANNLRLKCEFDKAEQIYEKILDIDNTECEAHWGIVLCKYGIEYIEDPKTFKRVPTCHRTLYESIMADANYISAILNADTQQKAIYEQEAKAISEIQKNILNVVNGEKPFDVFICYKETDENGNRTPDSAIANDIYYQLTQEGLKVFYAAITLEDKLGQEYEPYIFAALTSAKVMLVVGTKPQHFDAVWVRNEWSRFLKLTKTDRNKLLIPCYKDMDAYKLPEDFAHLQAQDMGKIGFINDVVRGIKKVVSTATSTPAQPVVTPPTEGPTNIAPLIERVFMFLEDGNFASANEYCEKVLDIDPKCADAYLGKLMAELQIKTKKQLADCSEPFNSSNNYEKIIRFGDDKLKTELATYIEHINTRNENARKERVYNQAKNELIRATTIEHYKSIIGKLQHIADYKDAKEQINICNTEIEKLKEKAKAEQLERERQKEIARIKTKKRAKLYKKIAIITTPIICVIIIFTIILNTFIIPNNKYNNAVELMNEKKYTEAISIFESLNGYNDSENKIIDCTNAILEEKYNQATALFAEGKYREAISIFTSLDDYKDSKDQFSKILRIIAKKETISAGSSNTVGLKADGSVVATGNKNFGQNEASSWNAIVTISVGSCHTVGLKADGTVVVVGYNIHGQCDVSGWTDIVAISAGFDHTVGLKADGTVVAVGDNDDNQCDVIGWTDIVAISAGGDHIVGLKADGTVVAVGNNGSGECDVSDWTDIVAISAGSEHTVGLKADGTVVAVGRNDYGQCNVSDWTDIVAVSAGGCHTVGLKADGTVVTVGDNKYDQCNVNGWTDIVAISAGTHHTVGLKSNGTVVAVGNNILGECNVSGWNNIKLP